MFSDLGFSDQTMHLLFKRSLTIVIEGASLAVVKKGSFSKIVFKNCRFLKMIPDCTALFCSTVKLRAKKNSVQYCTALRTKIIVLFRLFWRHYAIIENRIWIFFVPFSLKGSSKCKNHLNVHKLYAVEYINTVCSLDYSFQFRSF